MRYLPASVDYLDEADVFGTVVGSVLVTDSTPAKATVLRWDYEEQRMIEFDLLANVEITEQRDGSLQIEADSRIAEESFGIGNSKVKLNMIVGPGCKGCGN